MSLIDIVHSHSYDKVSACERAELMLEDLANDYGLKIESHGGGCIDFTGSGISGSVTINNNEINITAKLGFLMAAMKPMISNAIETKLKERFK